MTMPRRILVQMFTVLLLTVVSGSFLGAQEPEPQPARAAEPDLRLGEIPGTRPLSPADKETEETATRLAKGVKPAETLVGDHVAAGISLRNRGGGVINLRGARENPTAIKALMYWDILDNSAPQTMTVSINGVAVQGKLIGKGAGACWAGSANLAYRAEVPLYVLHNGINGDYKVAGFPSNQGTGTNPWEYSGTVPLAEGATLVVVYRAPGNPFSRTHLYEAPVSGTMFSSTFGTTLVGFTAPSSRARFTLIGADGQIGQGLNAFFSLTNELSFFQGTQIAGPGSPTLNNDSDWNGHDGEPLNQLWDTRTQIVPIKQGSTSAPVRYRSNGDCLVTVAFVLSL